jgi:branched-chain amino acid transport system permease protein
VTIACLVGWFAVMRNVVVSRHGGALRVLRQSTVLASSLGINSNRTKLTVYMLGSVPAGIAGCLFVLLDSFVTPDYFVLALAIAFIAGSVLGGSESVYGALVGAAIIQILLGRTTVFAEYALVAYGVLLVLGGVLLAGGITGLVRHGMATVVRRIEPEPDTEVDGTLTPTVPPQGPVVIGADDDVQVPGEDLQVEAIAKRFGGVQALDDVTLRARAGTVTALIGANGSGKTTLVNIISGFYRPNSGTVALGGRRIDGQRPHRVSRRGVARTFQTPMIPKSMTTLEVVASARYARDYVGILAAVLRLPSFRRRRRADLEMSIAALETLGIAHLAHHPATALPLGSRRLVEMARALVARPAVLLLDEPASGLDEREVQHLGVVLRRLAEAGATVLLIEHNFQFVCEVSDHMYVLEFGRLIAEGSPDAVREDPAVIRSYLGQLADGASGESVEEAIHEGAVAAGKEETR